MQRFHPTSRPQALSHKAISQLADQRFMPPSAKRAQFQIASASGMDELTKAALERLDLVAKGYKTCVAGRFMPDPAVSTHLASLGIPERVDPADFFKFERIVIPFCGVSPRQRRDWENAGHRLEDLTSPQVRRAQVTLGLLKLEGAQTLVIGRHDDPESQSLAAGFPGTIILETTIDTARLLFAPAFGVVCQTTLSPRRVSWLVQQLRLRWRDGKVTFLDTVSPAMIAREEALERLLVVCDRVIIVGETGEASCEALLETTSRRGKPGVIISDISQLDDVDLQSGGKIALTAGAFAPVESIRKVAEALAR